MVRPVSLAGQLELLGPLGVGLLLALVSLARDVDALYTSMKALLAVLHQSRALVRQLQRARGLHVLALLLAQHRELLTSHLLPLLLDLVALSSASASTSPSSEPQPQRARPEAPVEPHLRSSSGTTYSLRAYDALICNFQVHYKSLHNTNKITSRNVDLLLDKY